MSEKLQTRLYILFDILSALCIWALFFVYRDKYIEAGPIVFDQQFVIGLIIVPLFWIILYGSTKQQLLSKCSFRAAVDLLLYPFALICHLFLDL